MVKLDKLMYNEKKHDLTKRDQGFLTLNTALRRQNQADLVFKSARLQLRKTFVK